ncbi:alpha-hydroxy acid oxidase [Streptomyces sp. NPDC051985]|uniref:alpha-hydroxy acid oxidase n=1 Tax=Streptomyces sp. NPDC051985 TaxID=3155807 RepID=UPI003438E046
MSSIVGSVSTDFATLGEIRDAALARFDPAVTDFVEGGAGDEVTLRRNRAAFERWAFRPLLMTGHDRPDTATTFLGEELALPVLTAPFGADGLIHPEGHKAVARANKRAGVVSIVPEAGTFSFADVHATAPGAARIAQVHPVGSDEDFAHVVANIEAAGYDALCVTCDCATAGWRERNRRNRWTPDPKTVSGNRPPDEADGTGSTIGRLLRPTGPVWSWLELGTRLSQSTSLPWLAKGVMTDESAFGALDAGASGLLVSNHGGRQLDGQLSSLEVLPRIRAAVGPDVPIALDSGVRRGSDVIKAIALGADVVVLGRLAVYALAAAGEEGLCRMYELLHEEMVSVLANLGRGSVRDLDRTAVTRTEPF